MMDEPLEKWSAIWPRSGMTVNGTLYPLPMLVRRTSASASGLWPTALADGDRTTKFKQGGTPLGVAVRHWPTPDIRGFTNDGAVEMLKEKANSREEWSGMTYRAGKANKERLWPTPKAQDSNGGGSGQNVQGGPSLVDIVTTFPTPGAHDYKGSSKWGQRRGQLDEVIENTARDQAQAQSWPTPRAQDAKHAAPTDWELQTDHAGTKDSLRVQIALRDASSSPPSKGSGQLNPTWVEWLMGYPSGWTDLGD